MSPTETLMVFVNLLTWIHNFLYNISGALSAAGKRGKKLWPMTSLMGGN